MHAFVDRDEVRNTVLGISVFYYCWYCWYCWYLGAIVICTVFVLVYMILSPRVCHVVCYEEMGGGRCYTSLRITAAQTSVSLCMSISQEHKPNLPPIFPHNYLFREVWPMITRALKKRGIGCELDLVEGSMTVRTTRKTDDPYSIIKAR